MSSEIIKRQAKWHENSRRRTLSARRPLYFCKSPHERSLGGNSRNKVSSCLKVTSCHFPHILPHSFAHRIATKTRHRNHLTSSDSWYMLTACPVPPPHPCNQECDMLEALIFIGVIVGFSLVVFAGILTLEILDYVRGKR